MKKMLSKFEPLDIIAIVILMITGTLILFGKNGVILKIFETSITAFFTKLFLTYRKGN